MTPTLTLGVGVKKGDGHNETGILMLFDGQIGCFRINLHRIQSQ
jgi:hypothetical protein